MTIFSAMSLTAELDLSTYVFGMVMLLIVMLIHGVVLVQIAKRYEVKSFLYLNEHRYSEVAFAWIVSVMISMTKNFHKAYTRRHMEKLKIPAEVIERFK